MSDLHNLSDDELIRRIREGDDAAFGALSDRYTARLQRYVEKRLSPRTRRKVAASDIIQEANLVALRRFSDFEDRGDGSFPRWLTRIVDLKIKEMVKRYAGTQKRAIARELSNSGLSPVAGVVSPDPTPSQVIASRDVDAAVNTAWSKLPPQYRDVLTLLQFRKLTLEDAAVAMGRSKEATKKLYLRALARLEELMGLDPGSKNDERRRPTR